MSRHLSPDTRHNIVDGVRRINNKRLIARVFGVSRKTVGVWCKRAFHRGRESFKDRRQDTKPLKISDDAEKAIVAMRVVFSWGTGRIQQGLVSLPDYARETIEKQ